MSCFCFVWCIHDLYQTLSSAYSAYHQPKPPPQLHREAVIDRWKNRFVPKEFKGWGAKHQKCSPKNTFIFFLNSLPIYVVVVLLMLTSCFLVFLNKKKSTESVNTYKVWPIRTNSCFILLCVEGEPLLAPRISAHCVEEVVFVCKCWIC